LQLSLDEGTVYLATDDTLFTVDADSGTTATVIDKSKGLSGVYAMTVLRPQASWSNYGAGFPGTNGVPAITSASDPELGTTVTVDVVNSYGQPTIGLLIVGFQQTFIHSSLGGDLLVVPSFVLPITFSFGSDSFVGALPNDPSFVSTELELQVVELDPGAAKGVSFTQGLELVLGY